MEISPIKHITSPLTTIRRKQKSLQATTYRGLYNFDDQIQLNPKNINSLSQSTQSQQSQNPHFRYYENPKQSEFTYRKYVLVQKILLLITILWMFLCVIRTQMFQLPQPTSTVQQNKIILVMNCVSISTIILVFLRGVLQNELQIDQKRFYCIRYQLGFISNITRYLQIKTNVIFFIGQIFIIIWQPITSIQGYKFGLFQAYDQIIIYHDVNTIMCFVSMLRYYLIIRSIIRTQIYASPRAVRLCNYNKINHDFIYCIKCLLRQKPFSTIFVFFFSLLIVLSYSLRICQGLVHIDNQGLDPTGFQNYLNCFWCIFITMTTAGYGDNFPKALPGRIVCVLAAFTGIISNSLMISAISGYFSMLMNQLRSYLTLKRLEYKKILQNEATQTMIYVLKLSQYLSSKQKANDIKKAKQLFYQLKQKMDSVKFRTNKIKSLVNYNNTTQQMNRLFQILRGSIFQSYQHQITLKQQLQQMPQNKKFDRKKIYTSFLPTHLDSSFNLKIKPHLKNQNQSIIQDQKQ